MKSYCRNSCLNVHYGRWLTRHCISDNWLLIHYLYQMLLHFATSSFPDFSRALLLDDLHSSISFLLIATPSLLSPWSCEDQFYFSGLLFYLLQKACPCHNTSIFLEALVNSSSVFFFFTCNSSKLQMSDSAGTDALGTNPDSYARYQQYRQEFSWQWIRRTGCPHGSASKYQASWQGIIS